jgi:hypothetical protein
MYYGGSNFARDAGYAITTSYDYDAPLNEYGYPNEPKFSLLKELHDIVQKYSDYILYGKHEKILLEKSEIHVYKKDDDWIGFFVNENIKQSINLEYENISSVVPKWSCSIVIGSLGKVIYNTASSSKPVKTDLIYHTVLTSVKPNLFVTENVKNPKSSSPFIGSIQEHISLTKDRSDYLYYVLDDISLSSENVRLSVTKASDYFFVFWDGIYVNSTFDGELEVSFRSNSRRKHTLTLVTQTLGLSNFGAYLESYKRGLLGDVVLNGEKVNSKNWIQSVGLEGEIFLRFKNKFEMNDALNPFTWYRFSFSINENIEGLSLALDMSHFGKGQLFVNGNHIGRYWNVKMFRENIEPPHQPDDFEQKNDLNGNSQTCDYAGEYSNWKCRTGDSNTPSQRFYHIPLSYLKKDDNQLVIFEEIGGRAFFNLIKVSTQYIEK